MVEVKPRPLTVYDYQLLPETGPQYQLVKGELHMAPAPDRFHQDVSANVYYILRRYLEQHRIGKLYPAPFDVYLTDTNVFQPDVCFIANEHRSILSDRGCEGAPDFVCEVLSPRTAFLDKGSKREVYARTGTSELWMIDPDAWRIHVYLLKQDADTPAATHGTGAQFTSSLFPGLVIRCDEIFKQ